MSEDRQHVIFGTGQVGSALAAHLAGLGVAVWAVSRHRAPALAAGTDWRPADAADPEAAADAAKGASVIYQCLNAPYSQWPERFPPLQRGVLAAAERTGALLVSLENLYGYGPTEGRPMTEDMPLAATGAKGRARAAMTAELLAAADAGRVRIAIGRASDFFGPGVTAGSALGERIFGNALAGLRADFVGRPDLPHTYSYVPDVAAGLATLGTDARAAGQVWHLPGPATGTTRALLDLVAAEIGHPVGVRSLSKLSVRALGLVNPVLRELAETYYQFNQPFVLDTSKYESAFGAARHPAGRRHRRYRGLVPDPAEHAMTTPLITVTANPAGLNTAGLTPAAAWSRRARRVGGFIQAAWPCGVDPGAGVCLRSGPRCCRNDAVTVGL